VTAAVFEKLLAIFLTVLLGWAAGRWRWLESGHERGDPARLLGNAAFSVFVPALLFRTTARLEMATMPWRTVAAYFVPVVGFMLLVYAWHRVRGSALRQGPAAPSVHAISAAFGNSVQLGIPMAAALFGEAGLTIHIALVSVHAIVLLSITTALVELDLARARARDGQASALGPMLRQTLRNTVVHPVVLPVLLGLLWNLSGIGLHPVLDEALAVLGSAVVPVCLVSIGLTLAYDPVRREQLRGVARASALKLLVQPALVLLVARWGFGLSGLPLSVAVLMAALPAGSNTLMFAQRYRTLEAEANAGIVVSTVAFVATASLWLSVLTWLAST